MFIHAPTTGVLGIIIVMAGKQKSSSENLRRGDRITFAFCCAAGRYSAPRFCSRPRPPLHSARIGRQKPFMEHEYVISVDARVTKRVERAKYCLICGCSEN